MRVEEGRRSAQGTEAQVLDDISVGHTTLTSKSTQTPNFTQLHTAWSLTSVPLREEQITHPHLPTCTALQRLSCEAAVAGSLLFLARKAWSEAKEFGCRASNRRLQDDFWLAFSLEHP